MRAINDLVIRGPRPDLLAFLQRLEGNPDLGWRRDREAEARLRSTGGSGEGAFCFRCTETPDRPAASLWLRPRGFEEWRVYTIHSLGKRMLSDEEYNHILADFASRILDPLSRDRAVRVEILPPQIRLEDYLSFEAERLLREFSKAANRTALAARGPAAMAAVPDPRSSGRFDHGHSLSRRVAGLGGLVRNDAARTFQRLRTHPVAAGKL